MLYYGSKGAYKGGYGSKGSYYGSKGGYYGSKGMLNRRRFYQVTLILIIV
jgi:hypothetical protein